MRYLVIENGIAYQTGAILDDDLISADDGHISVISIDDMNQYIDGEWNPIEMWGG